MSLIGFCIATSLYGPLSDVFGRRRIIIAGKWQSIQRERKYFPNTHFLSLDDFSNVR